MTEGTIDMMLWSPSMRGKFTLRSFHKVLMSLGRPTFAWTKILQMKPPSKTVFFFVWRTELNKTLTTNNLRKCRVMVLDWCCI